MKKVLFIMLIAVLLVALAAPAFADKKVTPNAWGQAHKNIEDSEYDKVSDAVHDLQEVAKGLEMNFGQFVQMAKEDLCD